MTENVHMLKNANKQCTSLVRVKEIIKMDESKAKRIIEQALQILVENDRSIIDKRVKEECITHKFAIYIEKFLNDGNLELEYDVDIEYDKNLANNKKIIEAQEQEISIRPDILVHKRHTHDFNLIAIEVKKGYSNRHDLEKIKRLLNDPYNYSFGFFISYLPDIDYFRVKFYQKRNNQELIEEIYRIEKASPNCT